MLQRFDKTLKVPDLIFPLQNRPISAHMKNILFHNIYIYARVKSLVISTNEMSDSQEKKYGIKIVSLSHFFVYLLQRFDISTFTCNMR